MRVKIDPVYVSEHALDQMPRLDQLTIVRNQVRKGFEVIQAEAIKLLQLKRSSIRSSLEGAEWKLRQLVKA